MANTPDPLLEQHARPIWERQRALFPDEHAVVVFVLGHYHLFVAGVLVASEGDLCRDQALVDRVWTKRTLDAAAAQINTSCEVIHATHS